MKRFSSCVCSYICLQGKSPVSNHAFAKSDNILGSVKYRKFRFWCQSRWGYCDIIFQRPNNYLKIIESDEQWTLEIILPVYRVYFRMKRYVFHLDARQGLRFEICVISVSPYTALFPYPKFLRKDLSRTLPWPHGYLRETLQGSIYYAEFNSLSLTFSNLLEINNKAICACSLYYWTCK